MHCIRLMPFLNPHAFSRPQVREPTARVEHEASTSKIGEDQLFYFQSRGVDAEKAVAAIIGGFCREVSRTCSLPSVRCCSPVCCVCAGIFPCSQERCMHCAFLLVLSVLSQLRAPQYAGHRLHLCQFSVCPASVP